MRTVTAIATDGSIKWRFTEPSTGQGVIAGPTVGPDGQIYVISDIGGPAPGTSLVGGGRVDLTVGRK